MSDTRCTCVIVKAPTYEVYVQTPCGIHLRMVEDMKLQLSEAAEWRKSAEAVLADHGKLLHEDLKGVGHLGESLRDVVLRMNRLIDTLKIALHKIACAECTVHDEHCERVKFIEVNECACDPRVAGAAIPGYVCPITQQSQKRFCEKCKQPMGQHATSCDLYCAKCGG